MDRSAEIMERLQKLAPQLLQPQPRATRGARRNGTPNTAVVNTVKSRAGMLRPETLAQRSIIQGRRRHSPYQARALGSGRGVLPAPDIIWTEDPQGAIGLNGRPSWETGHGRPTFIPGPTGAVHIMFPDWV